MFGCRGLVKFDGEKDAAAGGSTASQGGARGEIRPDLMKISGEWQKEGTEPIITESSFWYSPSIGDRPGFDGKAGGGSPMGQNRKEELAICRAWQSAGTAEDGAPAGKTGRPRSVVARCCSGIGVEAKNAGGPFAAKNIRSEFPDPDP